MSNYLAFCIGIILLGCWSCSNQERKHLPLSQEEHQKEFPGEVTHHQPEQIESTIGTINMPSGFTRIEAGSKSFTKFLRNLKIKTGDHIVNLYNGNPKAYQGAQYCILDIDVGTKDLQQCADAVMRIRAEYLFQQGNFKNIAFNFTNGETVPFEKYADGYRIKLNNNKIVWTKSRDRDYSYQTFRNYLDLVFTYAGSYSLDKQLIPVKDARDIHPGDVFIRGGFPGHAVMVMDVIENRNTGDKLFLLAQSYMPAQEVHVLVNGHDHAISPWYSTKYSDHLFTPEWTFLKKELKRWPENL